MKMTSDMLWSVVKYTRSGEVTGLNAVGVDAES